MIKKSKDDVWKKLEELLDDPEVLSENPAGEYLYRKEKGEKGSR